MPPLPEMEDPLVRKAAGILEALDALEVTSHQEAVEVLGAALLALHAHCPSAGFRASLEQYLVNMLIFLRGGGAPA